MMTYLRSFKNQDGITDVQAFEMESGGHSGCGFSHVLASLRSEIF